MCVCCTLLCLRKARQPGSAYVCTLRGRVLRHTLAWSLHLTAQASWLLELLSPVGKRKQKGAKVAHLIGFQIQKAKVFRAQQLLALKNMVLSLLWLWSSFSWAWILYSTVFFSPMMEKEKNTDWGREYRHHMSASWVLHWVLQSPLVKHCFALSTVNTVWQSLGIWLGC